MRMGSNTLKCVLARNIQNYHARTNSNGIYDFEREQPRAVIVSH